MTLQKIEFGDEGQVATRELVRRLERFNQAHPGLADERLEAWFRTLEALDRQSGGAGLLPVEDAPELAAAMLTALAQLEQDVRRGDIPGAVGEVAELTLGVALWAIRHDVALTVVEPVANALAERSNRAASKQELAAVFGLMQGVISFVNPALAADLERSNPERPWRVLHANFAITAIRTEDPLLMAYAFDALDQALPDERAGFYAEALALALAPGVAAAVRTALEERHRRWTQPRE